MATRPHRTPVPRSRFCDEFIRTAVRHVGDFGLDDTPAGRLRLIGGIRDAAEDALTAEVLLSRAVHGMSWKDIGRALGVSAQAAHNKHGGPAGKTPPPAP